MQKSKILLLTSLKKSLFLFWLGRKSAVNSSNIDTSIIKEKQIK